jgi:hypothetical protein
MEQKRKIPTLFYGGIVLCLVIVIILLGIIAIKVLFSDNYFIFICLVFIVNYLLVVLLDFRYEQNKRIK